MEAQDYIDKRTVEILAECHAIDGKYEQLSSQVQSAERQMRTWEAQKQKLCAELDVLTAMETALKQEDAPVEGGEES